MSDANNDPHKNLGTGLRVNPEAGPQVGPEVGLAAHVNRELPGALVDLRSLVGIPSIWADPAHHDDTHRSAEAVAQLAREAGAEEVEIVAATGGSTGAARPTTRPA